MTCPDHRESIELFVDGELSETAAADVRAHLAGCDECRAFHAELTSLVDLLTPEGGSSSGGSVAETRFWRRFEADLAVRVARGEIPFWRRPLVLPFPMAFGTVALALALVTVVVHDRQEMARLARDQARLTAHVQILQDRAFFVNALPAQADDVIKRAAAPMPGRQPPLPISPAAASIRRALPAPNEVRTLPDGMQLRFVNDSQSVDMY